MATLSHPYPTARDSGTGFPLSIATARGTVTGATVREFLENVLRKIEAEGAVGRIEIPFRTSGENYLIARSPAHSGGRPFVNTLQLDLKGSGGVIYVNINHPRFFALRQGARLLEAAGLRIL